MRLFDLKGKVAVVTGASGLLGRQHCAALAEAGAMVVACDVKEDPALASSINGVSLACDVTKRGSIESVLQEIRRRYDGVDILVNNAAINDMFENPALAAEQSKFENYPVEMWNRMFDVNVTGMFLCSQVFGSDMARRGRGSIINIASTYGVVAPDQSLYRTPAGEQKFFKSAAYPATKGAVLAFTRFLAAYWGAAGVRVNALSPGGVENSQDEYFIEAYCRRTPLGRMAHPQDYQGALVFLASDSACYMTGANLIVDGGWTAW